MSSGDVVRKLFAGFPFILRFLPATRSRTASCTYTTHIRGWLVAECSACLATRACLSVPSPERVKRVFSISCCAAACRNEYGSVGCRGASERHWRPCCYGPPPGSLQMHSLKTNLWRLHLRENGLSFFHTETALTSDICLACTTECAFGKPTVQQLCRVVLRTTKHALN